MNYTRNWNYIKDLICIDVGQQIKTLNIVNFWFKLSIGPWGGEGSPLKNCISVHLIPDIRGQRDLLKFIKG